MALFRFSSVPGLLIGFLCVKAFAPAGRLHAQTAPQPLRLTYRSEIDQTDQPYRLYVPAAYDGSRPLPLVIALHGTGGNEASLFDEERYQKGAIRQAAEKHGLLLASPLGRGTTEYRGIGENDVLCVLADVQKRYKVDPDRVYLTGHSMGGTGAAYLALHHPDLFAAAAPLAAAYSFPWLARNAASVPFLWIGGAADHGFYHRGVAVGVERMRKFGVNVLSEAIPGKDHYGPVQDFDRVFGWLLQHQRDAHPKSYFFELDTPLHGRAWWTTVERIAEPGRMASIAAEAGGENRVRFTLNNVAEFTFTPDPHVFDLSTAISGTVGAAHFNVKVPRGKRLRLGGARFGAISLEPDAAPPLTAYRNHPAAEAPEPLDMQGTEKRLANWIADAMRSATGADVALYAAVYYRGLPLPQGTVDVVDLVQCSRPFDQYLVTVRLTGRDIQSILDANASPKYIAMRSDIDTPGSSRLVQLSGARYTFDPERPAGQRIVDTDLQPDRIYTVALEGQVVERETLDLAGRFEKLDYQTSDVPFTLALYGHAAKKGRIEARLEGRVQKARQ